MPLRVVWRCWSGHVLLCVAHQLELSGIERDARISIISFTSTRVLLLGSIRTNSDLELLTVNLTTRRYWALEHRYWTHYKTGFWWWFGGKNQFLHCNCILFVEFAFWYSTCCDLLYDSWKEFARDAQSRCRMDRYGLWWQSELVRGVRAHVSVYGVASRQCVWEYQSRILSDNRSLFPQESLEKYLRSNTNSIVT